MDTIYLLAQKVEQHKENINSESATITSLVMPFFQALGYDTSNPLEVVPEFSADAPGTKNQDKVDLAIMTKGKPLIVVECKSCKEENISKYSKQLFKYFNATEAKFGILTNGIIYHFYADLDKDNIMDSTPFFTFDILNIDDELLPEIEKFHKDNFNASKILSSANQLKHTRTLRQWFQEQADEPDDNFMKLMLEIGYGTSKTKTQKAISEYRPIVKHAFTRFLNEYSQAEFEAYAIVKSILIDTIDVNRLSHKHTTNYMAILLDDNSNKRICRLWFKGKQKYITTPDENMNPVKREITSLNDIYNYAEQIREVCSRYL